MSDFSLRRLFHRVVLNTLYNKEKKLPSCVLAINLRQIVKNNKLPELRIICVNEKVPKLTGILNFFCKLYIELLGVL